MQELLIYNKIPVIKDIAAIFRGEDVSRMDMQAITNLKKAWDIDVKMLSMALGAKDGEKAVSYNGQLTAYGVLAANLRAVSQLSGLPFYNAMRDTVALYNTVVAPFSGVTVQSYRPTSRAAIKSSYLNGFMSDEDAMAELVKQGVADDADQAFWIINDWHGDGSSSDKLKELYAAVKAEDTESYDALMQELTEHGVFKSKIQNDVKNQIQEWYQGTDTEQSRISKEDAQKLLTLYGGKNENEAEVQVQKWTCEKVTGIAYGSIDDEFINGNITKSRAIEMYSLYGKVDKEEAQEMVNKLEMRKDTGYDYDELYDIYSEKLINDQQLYDYQIKYGSKSEESAKSYVKRWGWTEGDSSMKGISDKQVDTWDAYVAQTGMKKKDYYNAIKTANDFKSDTDSSGNTITGSKQKKVWEYIDGLDISDEQKDALHLCMYSKSTLKEAPWNKGR